MVVLPPQKHPTMAIQSVCINQVSGGCNHQNTAHTRVIEGMPSLQQLGLVQYVHIMYINNKKNFHSRKAILFRIWKIGVSPTYASFGKQAMN